MLVLSLRAGQTKLNDFLLRIEKQWMSASQSAGGISWEVIVLPEEQEDMKCTSSRAEGLLTAAYSILLLACCLGAIAVPVPNTISVNILGQFSKEWYLKSLGLTAAGAHFILQRNGDSAWSHARNASVTGKRDVVLQRNSTGRNTRDRKWNS